MADLGDVPKFSQFNSVFFWKFCQNLMLASPLEAPLDRDLLVENINTAYRPRSDHGAGNQLVGRGSFAVGPQGSDSFKPCRSLSGSNSGEFEACAGSVPASPIPCYFREKNGRNSRVGSAALGLAQPLVGNPGSATAKGPGTLGDKILRGILIFVLFIHVFSDFVFKIRLIRQGLSFQKQISCI